MSPSSSKPTATGGHEPDVIRRLHKIPNKGHSLWMWFCRCECGQLSPWLFEQQYAADWHDKHLLMVANGVLNPTKSLTVPRTDTVYKQYRLLQDDERYSDADRALFRQMADELEPRTKSDEVDPDQLELF